MQGVASFPFISRVGMNSCFGPDCKDLIFESTEHSATMIYLSGLVGFLLVLTAEARIGNSSHLQFCTDTEQCLLFDLICKTDNYEVRHYDSVKWVSTEENSSFMEIATMRAFKRLFNYITGANENGKKIKMTAPVLIKIFENKSFWQTGTYTLSFLLPSEEQTNPPKPSDNKVYIHHTADMKVYVQTYGGWMTSLSDKNKASSLSSALDSAGAEYNKGFHYAAGYNSPMTIFNRHNEVWFVAEDDPVCPSSEEMNSSPLF
ncbi:heme-binding protein 2 isoform X1 [Etheostoma cragini]|uniref:heme-binding protein 2 isoform X1 n=1 Tax=Etheostoma cragini TaxID=417921 RepID=UPI00155E49D4|nr:heme-binding protein 2 isoform X1 [Etheostoma cragini]